MTKHPDFQCVRAPRRRLLCGMTLLEVMVAMFVLIFVFGGVIASVVRASTLTRDSKVTYRSTAIMNDLVERMRSMTFAELKAELADASKNEGKVPPPSGTGSEQVLAGAYTYKWKRTFTSTSADTMRIVVEIWPEGLDRKKISVVTYISSNGLINK